MSKVAMPMAVAHETLARAMGRMSIMLAKNRYGMALTRECIADVRAANEVMKQIEGMLDDAAKVQQPKPVPAARASKVQVSADPPPARSTRKRTVRRNPADDTADE